MKRARIQLLIMLVSVAIAFAVVVREVVVADHERQRLLQLDLESAAQRQLDFMVHEHDRYQDQLQLLAAWLEQLGSVYESSEKLSSDDNLQSNPAFLSDATRAMTATAKRVPVIDHARILDANGMELARVQRGPQGEIKNLPVEDLQAKGHRPYVQAFSRMDYGVVGATRISLNEERGVLEVPHRPMLRMGTRMRIAGEDVLLIVNYMADILLGGYRVEGQAQSFWVDREGYFLSGGSRFHDWIFGWQRKLENRTLDLALPALAKTIATDVGSGARSGYFQDDLGYYYWIDSPMETSSRAVPTQLQSGLFIVFQPYEFVSTDVRLLGPNAWPYWLLLSAIFVALVFAAFWVYWQDVKLVAARNTAESKGAALRVAYNRLREEEGRRADLLSVVGHEIRSPIASMSMLLEVPEAEWSTSIPVLKRLVRTTLGLLDDLKLVGNPIDSNLQGELRAVQLNVLLSDCLSTVAALVSSARMQVSLDAGEQPNTQLLLNVERVQAVVSNLLRNATLHAQGHQIWLTADLLQDPALLAILSAHDPEGAAEPVDVRGEYQVLRITVEDDGTGIPLEDRERLFDLFERGGSTAPGMGIGLHVVRQWLAEMEGRVGYFESPHGGAGFEILLRVLVIPQVLVPGEPSATEHEWEGSLHGKRIVVAEDDALLRKMTTRLFEDLGAEIIPVADGIEALREIEMRQPDLLVTDNFMPNMSGVQLLNALKEQGNLPPAVGVTAATIGTEIDEMMAAGALMVIAKPLRKKDLTQIISLLDLS